MAYDADWRPGALSFPDQEGIETEKPRYYAKLVSALSFPDQEGIETYFVGGERPAFSALSFPDQEGIETSAVFGSSAFFVRSHSLIKKGLKPESAAATRQAVRCALIP